MDDDSAADKFCEEDIDQILERRTQVITIESEKGSSFSKATFSSKRDRTDIDIDDPDFWKKWAKKAEIDVDKDEKVCIFFGRVFLCFQVYLADSLVVNPKIAYPDLTQRR